MAFPRAGVGHGCWDPGDRLAWEGYGPGHGRGYGYGPRVAGRCGGVSPETTAAQLEAYLASLQDEVRAIETDLADLRAGGGQRAGQPQV
jgi:hypothetical protein